MKVGFYLTGARGSSHSDLIDQAAYGDAAGYDSVWFRERHFHPDDEGRNFFASPLLAAAFVASQTTRMRLGIGARILPLDHPLHIAEAVATLDVLSGGRVDLGIARIGENELYEQAFGVDREETRGRFQEALEILLRAWTEERFSFEGQYYRIPDVSLYPKPATRPHPTVYLVGITPGTLAFGAARGFPLLLAAAQPVSIVRETQQAYAELLAEAGFDPAGIVCPVNRFVYVAETNEQAERDTRETLLGFFNRTGSVIRDFLKLPDEEITYELLTEEVCIFGDADHCRNRILALRETLDVRHLVCTFNYFNIDHELCRASMERFTERVLPELAA